MMVRVLVYIGLLGTVHLPISSGDEAVDSVQSSPDVLDAMSAIDSVYGTAFTVQGQQDVGPSVLRPADLGGAFEFRFTRTADESVFHRKRVSSFTPAFIPKGKVSTQPYDDDGNLIALVLQEDLYYFTPAERFRLDRFTKFIVNSSGEILSEEPYDHVRFFAFDDANPTMAMKLALWSVGRCYSEYIHEVLESTNNEHGELQLTCSGFSSPASQGTWRLTVDPSRSYLVTSASFTRNTRETPSFNLTNIDSLSDKTGCIVGDSAKLTVDVGGLVENGFSSELAALEVDNELLDFARKEKQGPFPNAVGLDSRTGIAVSLETRPIEPEPEFVPQQRSRVRFFLLLLNAHVVLLLLGYWIFRKYKLRGGGS